MRVRDHLRHAIPDGDVAKIVARAVKELRSKVEARKFGKRKTNSVNPASSNVKEQAREQLSLKPPSATSNAPVIEEEIIMPRAPGRATRRDVAERDAYQCCYVSDDGRRCSSMAWIEYDHRLEWASNGPTWSENVQLLCRSHNQAKQRQRLAASE